MQRTSWTRPIQNLWKQTFRIIIRKWEKEWCVISARRMSTKTRQTNISNGSIPESIIILIKKSFCVWTFEWYQYGIE